MADMSSRMPGEEVSECSEVVPRPRFGVDEEEGAETGAEG